MAEQETSDKSQTMLTNIWDWLGDNSGPLESIAAIIAICGVAWGIFTFVRKIKPKKDKKDQTVSELYVLYDDFKKQLENIQDPSDPRFERLRKIQEEIEKRIDDSLVKRAAQQGILIEDEADEKRDQAVKELVVHAKDDQQRKALSLIAEGNIDGGLNLLASQAQKASENAKTAQHEAINQWRRIGELAYGVDRKRALAAFEKVMELTPHAQAWDYIYLTRLYINSAQRENALATVEQGLSVVDAKDRDYFALLIEKSDLSILVGDREDAHSNLQTVHQYMLARANRDPENTEWQRDLSISYNKIADVLRDKGKADDALSHYQKSLEIFLKLAKHDPENTEWQRDLSVSYNKIADVLREKGKADDALNHYQKSLEIRQNLAKHDPENAEWQRDLSVSYNKIAGVLRAKGKADDALNSYQKSLEIRQNLAKHDPENTEWQRDLSVSYDKIADVLRDKGKADDALSHYQKSLEIVLKLAKHDPENTQWQRDLSISYNKIANVLRDKGKADDALTYFQEDLKIAQKLAKHDPENAEWQRDLLVSYAKLAGTPGSGVSWQQAVDQVLTMEKRGILNPVDHWMIEQCQKKLAAEKAAAQ
ncbi:tetratricopeptide repeat protein [Terasakiella sp.]|uniref:tetratricopeptide repeat protein n=1 Tax=Terasakiella sp. TaxID=2034861 RepID=UPI003AA8E0E0